MRLLAVAYGDDAVKYTGDERDAPDVAVLGSEIDVQVKRLTLQLHHSLEARWNDYVSTNEELDAAGLTNGWTVLLDLPMRGGPPQELWDMRGFRRTLVHYLMDLEAVGLRTNYGVWPFEVPESAHAALTALRGVTVDAHPLGPDSHPWVAFLTGTGGATPLEGDAVLDVVNEWINGEEPQAVKLRSQLAGSGSTERHAFVVLEHAVPEQWALDGRSAPPTRAPQLPKDVDVLWMAGPWGLAWRWRPAHGWDTVRSPSHEPS